MSQDIADIVAAMFGDPEKLTPHRHALVAIASDAGLPIEGRGENRIFDLEMCIELAWFGLQNEPDYFALRQTVETYRQQRRAKLT